MEDPNLQGLNWREVERVFADATAKIVCTRCGAKLGVKCKATRPRPHQIRVDALFATGYVAEKLSM